MWNGLFCAVFLALLVHSFNYLTQAHAVIERHILSDLIQCLRHTRIVNCTVSNYADAAVCENDAAVAACNQAPRLRVKRLPPCSAD